MTAAYHSSVQDVATVDSGPAFKSSQFGEVGEGIPLLRGENIEPGALRWSKTRTWPESLLRGFEHLFVEEGDLILGMDRPVISAGLKLAAARGTDLPALLVQRVARIRPQSIDGRYLYLWLTSEAFIRHLQGSTTGTQLPHVNLASIREFQVPRFGEDVERRIVDLLEDHLSRLDAADAGLRVSLVRSEAMLTSALWRATHGLDGVDRVELQSIAEVRLGRQRSPKNHNGDRMRPYLRAANVGWDELRLDDVKEMQFTEAEERTFRLAPGDILLTEASGSPSEVGKSAIYQGEPTAVCFQNTLLRVRCHSADPEFVQKYLLAEARAGRFMPEARGVGINHLSRARLATLQVDVPTPDLQRAAVAACRDLIEHVERLKATIDSQGTRSSALRRSLLAAAFSGHLTGGASDVSDAKVIEELAGV